ncbi:ferrous iron transport protein B [Ureibacillus sp. FSL K6-8385]|uniref:ferrous iron transport protein B n=1 Tax=Ureibacillus TaxID=160795 RepID=UPI002E1FB3FB|nr:ferrous iron transport protein B [Ureibacillus terrenus]MED3764002.1 ferrous iron transport protein B [Ureibacillus terrenus]
MEFALFGNPNTGKTSLFNILTDSYAYVGNWSGVTVEKKVGDLSNNKGQLIDLPGIYTINPLSKDEAVATEYLMNGSFEGIINIVDASQLLRNLQLTIQLLEFGAPMIVGLNMIDVAKSKGIRIDQEKLAERLGVPIIPIIARTGKGCDRLLDNLSVHQLKTSSIKIDYGPEIEKLIEEIMRLLPSYSKISRRWLAIQLIDANFVVRNKLNEIMDLSLVDYLIKDCEKKIQQRYGEKSIRQFLFKRRQQFIQSILADCVTKQSVNKKSYTEIIDAIVTNSVFGVITFLGLMFLIFKLTFDWLGSPLSDFLDGLISGPISGGMEIILEALHVTPFIQSLILEGIIGGVGGVLVFVPQIFILFFFISLLEDSGYMSRIAVIMDRILELVGLNGKAFIPLIIGFGCNVPGIMAARTIEHPKERLLTILLTPMMSCSARLTVYSLFVSVFFEQHKALIVLSLYVLGIVVAILLAKIFSLFIKTEESIFVIELPPYRVPQVRTLLRSTWDKGKGFVKKAGTFILGGTVVIWLLSYVGPAGTNVEADESFLALFSQWIAPLFAPLGFGTWQAAASLFTGFLAKEIVVSSMNVIYFVPDGESLQHIVSGVFTPLSAYSFMVFILLYVPCLATVATIKKETDSKKWMLFSIIYGLMVAYTISFIIYQGGRLLGIGQ